MAGYVLQVILENLDHCESNDISATRQKKIDRSYSEILKFQKK